jgi:hypothetical protein
MIRYAALAFLILTGPVAAQGYNRPDIVRGNCNPDGCDEFTVHERQEIDEGADGTLYEVRLTMFKASYAGRRTLGEEVQYAYCSTTKPAIIAVKGQDTMAFLLAPYSTVREPRDFTNFYALYFAVCHGVETGKQAARNRSGVARSLGYDVVLPQAKAQPLNDLRDILEPVGQ